MSHLHLFVIGTYCFNFVHEYVMGKPTAPDKWDTHFLIGSYWFSFCILYENFSENFKKKNIEKYRLFSITSMPITQCLQTNAALYY